MALLLYRHLSRRVVTFSGGAKWKKFTTSVAELTFTKKLTVACLRYGKTREIRQTGATTRELLELADWLKSAGCQMVAMESTGSYWKPLYNVLEMSGLPVMVANAAHVKAVSGRKTDVSDAEWIADLTAHGLLRASYIPDKAQRELRELVRYRKSLAEEVAGIEPAAKNAGRSEHQIVRHVERHQRDEREEYPQLSCHREEIR